ncbi:MAG TPA: L-rhamnose/proton symporter RhaT [Steroidobacteraceae bacterium]|nr:L-rhamnose/proton symporter RhaT [Steroidobacteraceae bacterium]
MAPTPLLGIPLHWIGGLASGSFYVPYRAVKRWSWETYWLLGGCFSWLICPLLFALLLTSNLFGVIAAQSASTLLWTYLFGLLWGFGGLTYGLTMRYLGLSLGTGVALGFCAAFGTLMPPILKLVVPSVPVAESIVEIASTRSGVVTLSGVAICFIGIAFSAVAGLKKEKELPVEVSRSAISEFALGKGLAVGTFSGIASSCFAFGLAAGSPIAAAAVGAGTSPIWSGLAKLIVLLWGGFTTNFIWCLFLFRRNRSAHQYVASHERAASTSVPVPLARNYLFSALAGTTWYLQYFFYTMGETQMGRYGFASWTLHMASIIIFATLWGWVLHEWKGSSRSTHAVVAVGIALLVASTVVIGWGTYLKAAGP